MPDSEAYEFGPFQLHPARRRLLDDGKTVALGARAFDLLVALVEGRGRVMAKEELMQLVWPGSAVEENNLTVNMSALRKGLRDRHGDQRYVRTIPGRGYRFVAPVSLAARAGPAQAESNAAVWGSAALMQAMEPGAAGPAAARDAQPIPQTPAIAVLPFSNMSMDAANGYFGDGIAEDIISALSRNRWLSVIARNSSFTFKGAPLDVPGIAAKLGVRYVLSGSVRAAGDQIRVTAHLMDAATNMQLVAQRWDRRMADLFSLQDEITDRITEAVRPALIEAEQERSIRRQPDSIDAWTAYQCGLWHFSRVTEVASPEARSWFERAIALDPRFAPGYYGLALALLHDGSGHVAGMPADWQSRGETLARAAVAADPLDSGAHSVLGLACMVRGDHAGALAATDAALALNLNEASAHGTRGATLMFDGRPEEGLEALAACIRLSPRDPRLRVRLVQTGLAQFLADRHAEAEATARGVLVRWPGYAAAPRLLAMVLAETGRLTEARYQLNAALALSPAPFDDFSRRRVPWYGEAAHGRAVAALRLAGWTGPA